MAARRALLLATLLLPAGVLSALPPGFDEELWCPPGACLDDREVAQGFVGPRAAFHTCVDSDSGDTTEPRADPATPSPQPTLRTALPTSLPPPGQENEELARFSALDLMDTVHSCPHAPITHTLRSAGALPRAAAA